MISLLTSNYPPLRVNNPNFTDTFFKNIEICKNLEIASGYISVDSITELSRIIVLNKKPKIKLIIGMHFFEGFTRQQYEAAVEFDNNLKALNLGEVFVCTVSQYHGKVYFFKDLPNGNNVCIIGSSNLSTISSPNRVYETDVLINESNFNLAVSHFLDDLSAKYCRKLRDIKIESFKKNESNKLLNDHYGVKKVNTTEKAKVKENLSDISFTIPLKASDKHQKSNLNVYFGKGRENKNTGFVKPRHWYEVEIIVPKEITDDENYPKAGIDGKNIIDVYTDDNWHFKCKISGDYSKNFRSEDDLKILGKWIKGRLENSGALQVGESVTQSVLKKYGRDNFTLTKSKVDNIWYLNFGV